MNVLLMVMYCPTLWPCQRIKKLRLSLWCFSFFFLTQEYINQMYSILFSICLILFSNKIVISTAASYIFFICIKKYFCWLYCPRSAEILMFSEGSRKFPSNLFQYNFTFIFKQAHLYYCKITEWLHSTIQCSKEEVSVIHLLLTCRPYACRPKTGSVAIVTVLIADPEELAYCLIPSCNYIKLFQKRDKTILV